MTNDEVKALIREVLAEMLGLSPPEPASRWVPLREAWKALGYPSYDALYKDVERGLFRIGKEVRDRRKPGAKIARLQIDVVAANKRLLEAPEKRRSV